MLEKPSRLACVIAAVMVFTQGWYVRAQSHFPALVVQPTEQPAIRYLWLPSAMRA
jgi:hypothetical protein